MILVWLYYVFVQLFFDYVLIFNAFNFGQFVIEKANFKFLRTVALFFSYFGFVGLGFLRVKIQMTRFSSFFFIEYA